MLGRCSLRGVPRGPRPGSKTLSTRVPRQHSRVVHRPIHTNLITRKNFNIAHQRCPLRRQTRIRGIATAAIPSILVPPLIFVGLLLSLWLWKCFWIVVMQDKLLYLSWLPPLTRSEKIADYASECGPVLWTERQIRSLDGTKLALCEGQMPVRREAQLDGPTRPKKRVVICYFQGNGGSTPMRLPLLSQFLRTIVEMSRSDPSAASTEYTVAALSYRGYWTSSGRATQSGIEMDAQAFLNWASETYDDSNSETQIILWGHSLGAAVATAAIATYLARRHGQPRTTDQRSSSRHLLPIAGLILEAPTSSIKDMLISLYPQRWLPYRYLWPFSWNTWDIRASMNQMAAWRDETKIEARHSTARSLPPMFLLAAEKDEVIPDYVPSQLQTHAESLNLDVERKDVLGAMHIEAPLKLDGRKALVDFIFRCTSPTPNDNAVIER